MATANGVTFLLARDGKFLMQHRTDNAPRYPGAWCFPGETREGDESPLNTVIRGIDEEYGLKVTPDDCTQLLAYTHDGQEDEVYYVQLGLEQQPVMREGKAMAWMSLAEIAEIELGFGQEVIVSRIADMLHMCEA